MVGKGGGIVFLFFYRVLFSLFLGRQLDMTEILTGQLDKIKGSVYSVDLELSLNLKAKSLIRNLAPWL